MIIPFYFLIGLTYWAINIFVRKLHTKNESGEGWFLVPFWVFFWWLCFIMLIAGKIKDICEHKKSEYNKF